MIISAIDDFPYKRAHAGDWLQCVHGMLASSYFLAGVSVQFVHDFYTRM